jgi:FtsH-binding integral membrane protein
MSQANPFANDSYAGFDVAARAEPNDRAAFLQKTYLHLAGAVGVFSLLQVLFYLTVPMSVTTAMFGSPLVWGGILVGFMGLSMLANKWAANHTSANLQYAGLGVYVLGLSVLFIPMIKIAGLMGEQQFGFSVAMVGLAGGTLLFHTGQILNHYPIGSHVAASLALFAALGTLFWYVLRIAMTIAASRD